MILIGYEYYHSIYGGSAVSEDNFNMIMNRTIGIANGYLSIDLYTYDESKEQEGIVNRLKTALCAAADCVSSSMICGSNEPKGVIASESVAGVWSKSYANSSNDPNISLRTNVYSILEDFLSGTEYLARGFFING